MNDRLAKSNEFLKTELLKIEKRDWIAPAR